jgi:hypothetical protein
MAINVEVITNATNVEVATAGLQGAAGAPGVPATEFSTTPTWRAPRGQQNATIASYTSGQMITYPFAVTETVLLDGLAGLFTNVGSGASFYTVIYQDNGSYFPGNLFKATSQIPISATTPLGETFAPILMPPGLYWCGQIIIFTTTTPTNRRAADANSWPWVTMPYGTDSLPFNPAGNEGTVVLQTGLDSPPATAGGTYQTNSNAPAIPMWVPMRIASL